MIRVQVEGRVNEIVERVIGGAKVEDDFVEAKGAWPKRDNACQLAAMANAAAGQPILWIVGLSENRHQVIPLEEVDPNVWWMQMEAEFAYGVAPRISVLTVHTDHGVVVALEFETDQAPYIVKIQKTGWTTAAIPWRTSTGVRTATRAQLLSVLRPSAQVPQLAVVKSAATMSGQVELTVPAAPSDVTFWAALLIDNEPGVHTFFPAYRQQVTLTSSDGYRVDCSDAEFVTSAPMRPADPNHPADAWLPRSKEFNQYGATERPTGLVVMAPDIVRLQTTVQVDDDLARKLAEAQWIDVTMTFPIGASDQCAKAQHRLLTVHGGEKVVNESTGPRRVRAWTTDGVFEKPRPARRRVQSAQSEAELGPDESASRG